MKDTPRKYNSLELDLFSSTAWETIHMRETGYVIPHEIGSCVSHHFKVHVEHNDLFIGLQ